MRHIRPFRAGARWGRAHRVDLPGDCEVLSFDNYSAVMQAVQQGLGVGLGLFPMLDPWLADGRIVLALDIQVTIPEAMYLVFVLGGERVAQLETLGARLRELLSDPG